MLASLDIDATVRFYEERLGFRTVATYADHAIVDRDGVRLHFVLTDDPEVPKATSCRIDVVGIDALADEMTAAGVVHPNALLAERPWGLREVGVLDGDGNLLTFAEPISPET